MISFLLEIKDLLGIPDTVTDFDNQLIMYINMVFEQLRQLGFGPELGYQISKDDQGGWDQYLPDEFGIRDTVLIYMQLKVRVLFDPPSSSFVLESINRAIAEYEWRLTNYKNPII